jgi:hypothetical protein
MGMPHTKFGCRVLCLKKYIPMRTPIDPPRVEITKKLFSLIRQRLFLDLYLSMPIKMKARALTNTIVQNKILKESIWFIPILKEFTDQCYLPTTVTACGPFLKMAFV